MTACQPGAESAIQAVNVDPGAIPYPNLSDYRFFTGDPRAQQPNDGVLPYELITPLFTDYAHKARFVWMPDSVQATVNEQGEIEFPDHTVLIKTFYYPADFSQPEKKRDLVETRLLFRRNGAWEAFTYVWNEAHTEATLNLVGDYQEVAWKDESGKKHRIQYVVPNKNQCKSCHNAHNRLMPIGPKVRNLNQTVGYPDGKDQNQLDRWVQAGYLSPGNYAEAFPAVARWDDPAAPLPDRALAYLDVNCGHCHRPEGPAHTTGLFLTADQTDLAKLGVCKTPVAAGKGSGNRRFGITPGQPDASILVYRMEENDPGIMMPELGRVIAHREGIELISEWIGSMDVQCE